MRWTEQLGPAVGSKRIRSWFAWIPVTIGRETRWLEAVTVRQRYGECWYGNFWLDEEFVTTFDNAALRG